MRLARFVNFLFLWFLIVFAVTLILVLQNRVPWPVALATGLTAAAMGVWSIREAHRKPVEGVPGGAGDGESR